MTETTHSPLPWAGPDPDGPGGCRPVFDAREDEILWTVGLAQDDIDDGNVALILRSVNSHANLVAALRKIIADAGDFPVGVGNPDTGEAESYGYDLGRWEAANTARVTLIEAGEDVS